MIFNRYLNRMAILTSYEILKQMESNMIKIEPFDINLLNINSYDLTLYPELEKYTSVILNPRNKDTFNTEKIKIPIEGLTVHKGETYLARTTEYTETHQLVPTLHGKSSIGRSFLFAGTNAGYGDIGYKGTWTLPLVVMHDFVLYPFMRICQIQYETIYGHIRESYKGKYQDSREIRASRIYEEHKS